MKKLLLLVMVLAFTFSNAQTKMTTPSSTLKFGSTSTFYWKNGEDKFVPVQYKSLSMKSIDDKLFNTSIMTCLSDAKYNLKNTITFEPKEVSLADSDTDDNFYVTVEYIGKNDYGVKKLQKTTYIIGNKLIKGEYMDETEILQEIDVSNY